MNKNNLPNQIKTALNLLEQSGFSAYLVGGCVRDSLLEVEPKDYDIATAALPQQIEEIFKGYPQFDMGKRFGTIGVAVDGMTVEITTFRRETAYTDGRRPDIVVFTNSIEEDLARRDFTINAMAWHENRGLVDPFCGEIHLREKKIVAVGNPDCRFSQDGLRIMRAIRFSSVLDFDIEERTASSMERNGEMLLKVANERVREELIRLICGHRATTVLEQYFGIVQMILPEITPMKGFLQYSKYHNLDVWQHTLGVVANVPPVPHLRLAALLHDVGKPASFTMGPDGRGHFYGHEPVGAELAKAILRRLRFSEQTVKEVYNLILWHRDETVKDSYWVRQTVHKMGGAQGCADILALMRADATAKVEDYQDTGEIEGAIALLEAAVKADDCCSLKCLALNGDDLLALKIKPSQIGKLLNTLLDRVLKDPSLNDRNKLLKLVTKETL